MKVRAIPEDIFRKFGEGAIEQIPDSMICGHRVHRFVRRVVLPQVGEKLGWLRLVQSAYDDFIFEALEIHVSRENASADPGNSKHPEIVGAVFYVPATYYSGEQIYTFYDIHAGKKGTDGEDIAILGIAFQQEASIRLL